MTAQQKIDALTMESCADNTMDALPANQQIPGFFIASPECPFFIILAAFSSLSTNPIDSSIVPGKVCAPLIHASLLTRKLVYFECHDFRIYKVVLIRTSSNQCPVFDILER